MRIAAELIDVDALWHVALYSFIGGLGLVAAYGTLVVAVDHSQSHPERRGAWPALAVIMGVVCVAVVVFGVWAMTQKP